MRCRCRAIRFARACRFGDFFFLAIVCDLAARV
jgi:hypothetical protein